MFGLWTCKSTQCMAISVSTYVAAKNLRLPSYSHKKFSAVWQLTLRYYVRGDTQLTLAWGKIPYLDKGGYVHCPLIQVKKLTEKEVEWICLEIIWGSS